MRLISNWRDAPRWYSMWAAGAVVALGSIGGYLTPDMLAAPILFLPDWTWGRALSTVTAFIGVSGIVGRLISQEPKADQ